MEHLHSMQRHDESPEGNTYGSETFLHEKRLGENPIRPLTVLIIFNMRDLANGRKDRNTQKKRNLEELLEFLQWKKQKGRSSQSWVFGCRRGLPWPTMGTRPSLPRVPLDPCYRSIDHAPAALSRPHTQTLERRPLPVCDPLPSVPIVITCMFGSFQLAGAAAAFMACRH